LGDKLFKKELKKNNEMKMANMMRGMLMKNNNTRLKEAERSFIEEGFKPHQ
jgi:hypothetical protein